MPKFVHLHTHSHYSLLDGLTKIDDLVNRVKELGMDSVALTDHGVLYGAIEFYKKAKKAGVKPILGVEAYVAPKSRLDRESADRYYHLVLLAKNETGWKNLIQLVTKAHLEGFYYKPRVDKELLREYHEGLIALTACLSGEVNVALMSKNFEEAKRLAFEYQDIFGKDNFYLEIGDHPHIPEAVTLREAVIALGKETGIPLAATQDSHYVRPEDAEYHDVLLAVQTGSKLSDDDRLTLKADNFSITSPEEMVEKFKDVPEAITNTAKIAERCNVTLELHKVLLPNFPKPEGKTANQYLEELIKERISNRYTKEEQATARVKDRVTYEVDVIEKTGFADYFLIVQDLVNWARLHGIAVGPGRGSAAGSIVSYILGITDIDPLKYDLLFERFLNPERVEMPDIDLDFADSRRDEVLAYAREKYGEDRVAQIITFGTMAARAAIRDAGRSMGLAYGFCDQLAKLIPFNQKLDEALKTVPELKELYIKNPDAKKLLDVAQHLEGVARHASVHACGTVISKEPLVNYVPLQFAPQDKDITITQFEMHAIADLGLLKIDLLGLRNLTTIQETVRLIRELKGETVNVSALPLDDPKTLALLQSGNTTGVFQFECLAGETVVSNTTIKKLYEKRHKTRLQSVYIDEGKVHKNKIVDVVKSGVKEVYALIAKNGWYIKATKNHRFLTEEGWKILGEIKPGDRVLMKTKARHLVFNTCQDCGVVIDGQKEGKSKFCYACSARFYSNPSKKNSRKNMRIARESFFTRGGTVWNEGVTTENNLVWKETALKISKALMGRSLEERVGKEKAEVIRKRLSEASSGSRNPMFGRPPAHRKGGLRDDLGHYVRSNWEADFARILKLHDVQYEYEPQTFALVRENGESLNYTPDFYVPSTNTFYEIKGWMHELDEEKIRLFQEQYSNYNFVLVNTTRFAELSLQYKDLVRWECPRIPVKQSFQFTEVQEIRYAGKEETYDIAMETPGNNFIANGFVVHNSSGMRRYMKEIRPTGLEDLIALVALYRPGPLEAGMVPRYIARKNGTEKIIYIHPRLEPILKRTYGIGVYQEQMMQIARDLAGYTLPEADTLRKAIGKKIKSLLDEQKEKLLKGMAANGIDAKTANTIWELFPSFARYGFNKSHAACYALIGYQTAYLKAHYPEEFMASLFNAELADIDRISFLVTEAKQANLEVLPPDVNASSVYFIPENGKIRFGLLAIKNVGKQITESIVEERARGGPFQNFSDFLTRVQHKDLNKKSLESLIKCGAFDSFGIERNQALASLEEILRFTTVARKSNGQNHNSLFSNQPIVSNLKLKDAPSASVQERLGWEKELLGFYLSDHPLNSFKAKIEYLKTPPLADALRVKDEDKLFKVIGLVSQIKKIVTKSGKQMLFATVEDFSSTPLEIIVFNSTLEKTMPVWIQNNVVLVQGRMSWRNNEPKMICNAAMKLEA